MARLGRAYIPPTIIAGNSVAASRSLNWQLRVRFTLYSHLNAPLANTAIKLATFAYAGGVATDPNWMVRDGLVGVVTTDASGGVDIWYPGSGLVGDTIYVAVIEPNGSPAESMIWTDTVQQL